MLLDVRLPFFGQLDIDIRLVRAIMFDFDCNIEAVGLDVNAQPATTSETLHPPCDPRLPTSLCSLLSVLSIKGLRTGKSKAIILCLDALLFSFVSVAI